MRPTRALTARSEADAEVQSQLALARKALMRAAAASKRARLARKVTGRRGRAVERQISAALSHLNKVPHLTPLWDLDDPDHLPEEVLAEIARNRRGERDGLRRKAKEAAEEEARRLREEEERVIEEMLDEALVAERVG